MWFQERVSVSCAVVSNSATSRTVAPARLLYPWDSLSKSTGVGCLLSPGGLPNPGIEFRSPALQADSLLSELPGVVLKLNIPACEVK